MAINHFNFDQLQDFWEYDQILSNGQKLHIASYINGYFAPMELPSEIYYCNSRNITQPSHVLDLNPFINQAGFVANADVTYVFNAIFGALKTEDYYQTEEYLTKEDLVKSKIRFIWGSWEKGGLFVFKDSANNGKATFYLFNGWFTREIEGETYFGAFINYGGNYGAEYDFSKCIFFYDATRRATDVYGYQLPVTMIIGGDDCTINVAQWEWNLAVQPTPYYMLTAAATSFDRIDEFSTTWSSVLVDGANWEDPLTIFNFNGLIKFRSFYDPFVDQGIITKVSGSPTGDDDIETEDNPYSEGGFSSEGGGNGTLDNQVDTNDPDDDKATRITTDAVTSGICKIYNPTASQLNDFNTFLYSGITDSIANTLKKLTTDPLQYIISLGMVHFNPPTSVNSSIMMASVDTGVTALRVNRQYTSLDFGYIDFATEFKSFLDYNPYSKISIYLPYIGQREMNMDECRGSRIRLIYNIDMITGSCVAYIHISRSARSSADTNIYHTMYSFEGNCLTQIPMFATDNRGAIQSLLSVAGAGVSLATGNVAGAVTGLINGVTTQKISVGRAGSISSNYGYISNQQPYLIAERPIVNIPVNFGAFEGWTSNLRKTVSQLHGYTEIDPDTIWSDNFGHATAEECDMIKTIMNGGVYL